MHRQAVIKIKKTQKLTVKTYKVKNLKFNNLFIHIINSGKEKTENIYIVQKQRLTNKRYRVQMDRCALVKHLGDSKINKCYNSSQPYLSLKNYCHGEGEEEEEGDNFKMKSHAVQGGVAKQNPYGGLTDRQIDRQTDRQIDRQTDIQIDRQTDRQIDRYQKYRQTEIHIDRYTEIQIDGQTYRQIDSQTIRQFVSLTDRQTYYQNF